MKADLVGGRYCGRRVPVMVGQLEVLMLDDSPVAQMSIAEVAAKMDDPSLAVLVPEIPKLVYRWAHRVTADGQAFVFELSK